MEHCLVYYTHRGAFWLKILYAQGQKYIYDKELLTHRGDSDNTFSQMSESPGYARGGVPGNSHWLVYDTTQHLHKSAYKMFIYDLIFKIDTSTQSQQIA